MDFRQNRKNFLKLKKRIIEEIAKEHDCVIIGRCSDYILHETEIKDLFSVFVYAPYTSRFNNCLKALGLGPEAAEVYLDKVDSAREKFYEEYTGETFTSPKYRNLMIDSSALPIEDTVKIISIAAKTKFGMK